MKTPPTGQQPNDRALLRKAAVAVCCGRRATGISLARSA
jgi:hypothetical protein